MKAGILGMLFAMSWVAPMAHAALEFAGYISSGGEFQFIVTSLDSRRTSEWMRIGDTFEGHKMAGFDASDESLIVEHAGAIVRLSLKGSRVQDAKVFTNKVHEIIAEIIAVRFHDDRSKFLSYLRSRGITLREYRREVEAAVLKSGISAIDEDQTPNKAPEPTPVAVTPRATEGASK